MLFEPTHGAGRSVETECAAAGEDDGVDLVHHVERVQQIRFAGARRSTSLRDAAHRVAVHENDGAAGRPFGEGEVSDLDPLDGGERGVRRRRALGREPDRQRGDASQAKKRAFHQPTIPHHHDCDIVDGHPPMQPIERILVEVDRAADEIVQFTADLVRIPTVNPPGEEYETCARFLGEFLERRGFAIEYIAADGRPEHTARYPRVNVIGSRRGGEGPVVHLNGHIDVVPAGDGWTVDPFGGLVRDGKIFGRGVCDMKAGLAAAVFAAEAIERAGVRLPGTIEISGTVDEESGGFAGVAYLAETGRIRKGRTDFVIIPEPLNVDRICIGHRRRVLVRGDRARTHRTRQHAVSGRERD